MISKILMLTSPRPRRNPCGLFIHFDFFGSLGLHLLVWSGLERFQLFDLWEILKCDGHGPSILCVKWPFVNTNARLNAFVLILLRSWSYQVHVNLMAKHHCRIIHQCNLKGHVDVKNGQLKTIKATLRLSRQRVLTFEVGFIFDHLQPQNPSLRRLQFIWDTSVMPLGSNIQ